MEHRQIDFKTGVETAIPYTQAELDAIAAYVPPPPLDETADEDLLSDIAAAVDFDSLKQALLGNGPKRAKVKGRRG